MNIVASTDKLFVMPTGVMIYSVCVNNPDTDIVFHVLVNTDVTSENKRDLEKVVSQFNGKTIVFYDPNQKMQSIDFPPIISKAITKTTYYRLFMAELLPPVIDKVLYLDVDIIVRHSLLPLWNIDVSNYAVAAIPDIFSAQSEVYSRLHIPRSLCYVNSGVLLINLKYWRSHSLSERFQSWMVEHIDVIRYGDQDILNAVLKEKILLIPQKFNLMHGYLWKQTYYDYKKYENDVLDARRDPTIVHFTGAKPWDAYCEGEPHPLNSTFYKYQQQTKWKDERIDIRPYKKRISNFCGDILRKLGLMAPRKLYHNYIEIAPID